MGSLIHVDDFLIGDNTEASEKIQVVLLQGSTRENNVRLPHTDGVFPLWLETCWRQNMTQDTAATSNRQDATARLLSETRTRFTAIINPT